MATMIRNYSETHCYRILVIKMVGKVGEWGGKQMTKGNK